MRDCWRTFRGFNWLRKYRDDMFVDVKSNWSAKLDRLISEFKDYGITKIVRKPTPLGVGWIAI